MKNFWWYRVYKVSLVVVKDSIRVVFHYLTRVLTPKITGYVILDTAISGNIAMNWPVPRYRYKQVSLYSYIDRTIRASSEGTTEVVGPDFPA